MTDARVQTICSAKRWIILFSLLQMVILQFSCQKSSNGSTGGGAPTIAEDEVDFEVSATVDPVDFVQAQDPVEISGVNLTLTSKYTISAFYISPLGQKILAYKGSSDSERFTFKSKVPNRYLTISVTRKSDGYKISALLPPPLRNRLAKLRFNRTSTIAAQLARIIADKAASGDQSALQALATNSISVADTLIVAQSVTRVITELAAQNKGSSIDLAALAAKLVERSNDRISALEAEGQSAVTVAEKLADKTYESVFSDDAETIAPGVLAYRTNHDLGSSSTAKRDVAYEAITAASSATTKLIDEAFRVEADSVRNAESLSAAVAAQGSVATTYTTKFNACYSGQSSCAPAGYTPPAPPSSPVVIPVITINTQPSSQTASGGSATFTVAASVTENATLSYQWQKKESNGSSFSNISSETSATLNRSSLTNFNDDGDSYRVVVSATGGATSVTSSSATLTVPAETPGIPTAVSGTAGNAQVSLTWAAPSNDGGSPITDYIVEHSSNSGSSWTTFNDGTSTSASANVTGLTNGTSYIFRVAAVNAVGTGIYSNNSGGVTPALDPYLSNVSLLLHMDGGNGSSAFTDSSLSNNFVTGHGNAVVSTARSTFGGASMVTNGSGWLTIDAPNVGPNGSEDFTVEMWIRFRSSPVWRVLVTPPSRAQGAFQIAFNGDEALIGPLDVGWDLQLRHTMSLDDTKWHHFAVARRDGLMRVYQDGNLIGATSNSYNYNAAAGINLGGASWADPQSIDVFADEVRITKGFARYTSNSFTPPTTASDTPTAVSGTAGNAQVSLTWTAPSNDGGSPITEYVVQYSSNNGTDWTTFKNNTSTATNAVITGLTNGTSYLFRVAAVNSAGTGSYSAASNSVTLVANYGNASFSGSGSAGDPWIPNTPQLSCQGIRSQISASPFGNPWSSSEGMGQDGIYQITVNSENLSVYCDMTKDGGGWTRVVGINANNLNHSNVSVVAWTNADPTSDGKLSDAQINAIKNSNSSTTPVYRLMSGDKTAYFPGSCVFNSSAVAASGDCLKFSASFSSPVWLTAMAGDAVNGCGINSAYATLSAVKLQSYCTGPESSDSIGLHYRRVDWRGTSYDSGMGSGAGSGVLYVRGVTSAPNAPTDIAGTAGDAQVSLTWSAPASNGGSAITDYVVEYSSNNGTDWTTFNDGTSTTASVVVTGLTNGTTYVFRVAAKNSVGNSSFSSQSSSATPAAPPPNSDPCLGQSCGFAFSNGGPQGAYGAPFNCHGRQTQPTLYRVKAEICEAYAYTMVCKDSSGSVIYPGNQGNGTIQIQGEYIYGQADPLKCQ